MYLCYLLPNPAAAIPIHAAADLDKSTYKTCYYYMLTFSSARCFKKWNFRCYFNANKALWNSIDNIQS